MRVIINFNNPYNMAKAKEPTIDKAKGMAIIISQPQVIKSKYWSIAIGISISIPTKNNQTTIILTIIIF